MRNKVASIFTVALVVILTGCGSSGTEDEPSGGATTLPEGLEPTATLHVPETAMAGTVTDLVIDSTGHAGETAQLYSFRTPYDEVSDCTDTAVETTPISLTNGAQKVTINTGDSGDMWFVLSGEGFSTECGAPGSRLRALIDPAPKLGELTSQKTGESFQFGIRATVSGRDDAEPVEASVQWVGPFKTLPEANASDCPSEPVASTDVVELLSAEDGYAEFQKTIEKPGVYRILVNVPKTEYTAEYETACESAALVTVK